jgi:hypothetical protein
MHDPIPNQGQWLRQVVMGFFAYHAVPTNSGALAAFRYHVMVLWMRTLTRRSQKDRTGWDRINRLANQWLPKPRILHPWPTQRFDVKHPRWDPDAGMAHVRFCSGGAPNGHPYRNRRTAVLDAQSPGRPHPLIALERSRFRRVDALRLLPFYWPTLLLGHADCNGRPELAMASHTSRGTSGLSLERIHGSLKFS